MLERFVILSEAKNLVLSDELGEIEILHFVQDDIQNITSQS